MVKKAVPKQRKKKPRTFVIGDIHGAHIPLQQCIDRCSFDYENDKLITLGDICDGWPYVYECVDILIKIPEWNRIDIIGNHDEWFRYWLINGYHPDNWKQGGQGTMDSYVRAYNKLHNNYLPPQDEDDIIPYWQYIGFNHNWIPDKHKEFFYNQRLYYKDQNYRLFVHGGFDKTLTLKEQERIKDYIFYWDRDLWKQAQSTGGKDKLRFIENFKEIYIGHTATTAITRYSLLEGGHILLPNGSLECPPKKADIVYNLDTGAGSHGRLTIMDIETHKFWQSDPVNDIYGEYNPRSA